MFDAQAIIAEATADGSKDAANAKAQDQQATPEGTQDSPPEQLQVTNEAEEKAEKARQEELAKKPDSELTPEELAKREWNRESHARRKLAKQQLRNENAELKARLAKLETKPEQPKDSGAPKLENFDSLDEWVLATAKHLKDAELKTADEQKQSSKASAAIEAQRGETVQKIQKFASEVPEYVALVNQNDQILSSFPLEIETAFLNADNAPLALYALMKEDALEDLYDYPPERLAYIIGKAEERGKSYITPAKRVTSAPAPIESLKGTGRATKDIYSMSVTELMKQFNK